MITKTKQARSQMSAEFPFAYIAGDVLPLMSYWLVFFLLLYLGWQEWTAALFSLPAFLAIAMSVKAACSVKNYPGLRWLLLPAAALFLSIALVFFFFDGSSSALFLAIPLSMIASPLLSSAVLGW